MYGLEKKTRGSNMWKEIEIINLNFDGISQEDKQLIMDLDKTWVHILAVLPPFQIDFLRHHCQAAVDNPESRLASCPLTVSKLLLILHSLNRVAGGNERKMTSHQATVQEFTQSLCSLLYISKEFLERHLTWWFHFWVFAWKWCWLITLWLRSEGWGKGRS